MEWSPLNNFLNTKKGVDQSIEDIILVFGYTKLFKPTVTLLLAQSISLISSHVHHLPSVEPASQGSCSFCLFTSIPPYPASPSMPGFLTTCIALAATATTGLLPSTRCPPKGESACHSRLMPCTQMINSCWFWTCVYCAMAHIESGDAIPTRCQSCDSVWETDPYI